MAWIKCRGITNMQRTHALPYLTSPSFLCHFHSLPHPIVQSCLHLSHVLFVNRTSLCFTKEPSIQLPPTPGVPPAMLPLSVLFASVSDYFSPSKPTFFLSLISLGIYHTFLLMQRKNNYWYAYLNSLWSFPSTIK